MDGARSGDDRLPWLDAPRPAKPTATRRARTPLLAMLGLFFASAIAVIAYLAGRGTAPVAVQERAPAARSVAPAAPAPAPIPLPTPGPAVPLAPPPPVVTTPEPPTVAPASAAPATSRAERSTAKPKGSARRSAARPAKESAPRPVAPPVVVSTPPPPIVSTAPPRRIIWPAQPFAGPRGRVIQLGAYRTQAQADAAWWRLARSYPYLTTLPRMVVWVGPSPGRARIYRVRLAASSGREARALCRNLHRIGRGCAVV